MKLPNSSKSPSDIVGAVQEHINRPFLIFNDRKQAMTLRAYTGLYTLYSYQDLLTLAQSTNDSPLLTKLLNDTPLNFPISDISENILETISLKTYFFANKPIEYKISESTIYACLKKGLESLKYETQKERVGRLISYIMAHFYFESVIEHILTIVAKFALGQFMDIDEINRVLHSQISKIH